jgi:type VI secretion system protein ImpD
VPGPDGLGPVGPIPADRPLIDGLVDRLFAGGGRDSGDGAGPVVAFLAELDAARALALWFGPARLGTLAADKDALMAAIDRDIAAIDRLIADQVDAILHHPRLQSLEASWRGLGALVAKASAVDGVKIRVLAASWTEICRDQARAIEFDRSHLFWKIYETEFGQAGGEPYGILVCDYAIQHKRTPDHPDDDIAALSALSQVAAAGFVPMIFGCTPTFLGLDSFVDLALPIDLDRTFRQAEYARWHAFRDTEDSRFIGIVLPRVLMRRPWRDDSRRADRFRYGEEAGELSGSGHVWGSAAYAFAGVAMRAFGDHGWFADIRGAPRDRDQGGLVTDLVVDDFATDRPGLAYKASVEIAISDHQERALSDLGLIALCRAAYTPFSVFHGNASVQRPQRYDRPGANANARLSAMLQYMLCVGRFAHFLKVIGRDKLGSFASAEDCETFLQAWLHRYVTSAEGGSPEHRARYPLREGKVTVRELPGRPGTHHCEVLLSPHFQLDQLSAGVRLVTEINPDARV